ncbi:unnamed protein product [Schistocephalus solidus]|uniref:Proline rich 14 n=1 Tax=Schistocephalus solidus TaxID=70667 RepID=A0A183TPF4_SCHSO|nr:unnamed protein product [Schistocephalus solidus]
MVPVLCAFAPLFSRMTCFVYSALPFPGQTSSEKDMSQSANKEVVPSPVEPPTEASTSVPLLPLEQPTDLSTPLLSVLSAKPLPDFPVWQPSPVTQQSAPLIIEKVPDWLNVNKNYVPPALRGLETISEAAALRVGPATRPPPPPRGRRKKLPPPAPEQPVAAPLRILSFNDPAILCEVQADPEAPLSKFHIASARARLRRQKLRLKKLLSVNGGRCPPRVSVQTEHRFAEFLADWEMDAWQSPT